MDKKERNSWAKFFLGTVIYALLFLMVTTVGLYCFWNYIARYEASRPDHAIERYISSLDKAEIQRISAEFVGRLDRNVQSEQDSFAAVEQFLNGQISYARKGKECRRNKMVYAILVGSKAVGSVTFTKEDDPKFGFAPWEVSEESYDFTGLLSAKEVTVPDTWTVYCDGAELSQDYIVESGLEYTCLDGFYEGNLQLPHMVKYALDSYLGDVTLTAKDEQGKIWKNLDSLTEDDFLNNCTDTEKAALDDFIYKFITRYITFSSNANDDVYGNMQLLLECVVKSSELEKRCQGTVDSMNYTHSKGDQLRELAVNRYVDLGNGNFMVDVTFKVDTNGNQGWVTTTNGAKVLIVSTPNKGYQVSSMLST